MNSLKDGIIEELLRLQHHTIRQWPFMGSGEHHPSYWARKKIVHQIVNFSKKKIVSRNLKKSETDMSVRNSSFRKWKRYPWGKTTGNTGRVRKRRGTFRSRQGFYLGTTGNQLWVCTQRSTPQRWACLSAVCFFTLIISYLWFWICTSVSYKPEIACILS